MICALMCLGVFNHLFVVIMALKGQQHINEVKNGQKACTTLRKNFDVNDLLKSSQTVARVIELIQEIICKYTDGGF